MRREHVWEGLVKYFLKENLPFLQHLLIFEKPFMIINEKGSPYNVTPNWVEWFSLLAPHRRVEQVVLSSSEVAVAISKKILDEQDYKRRTIFVLITDKNVVPFLQNLLPPHRWVAIAPPLSPMVDLYTFDSQSDQWVPYEDPLLFVESRIVEHAIQKRSDEAWKNEILKYLSLAETLRAMLHKDPSLNDKKILKSKPFRKNGITCPELDFIKRLLKTLYPQQQFRVEPLDSKEIGEVIRHAKKELGKGILAFNDIRDPLAKKLINWLYLNILPKYDQYHLLGPTQLQELAIVTALQMGEKEHGEKWYEKQKEIVGLGKKQEKNRKNKKKKGKNNN